jgi:isoquinoline 1-oxidoreductase beta subunit
LYGDISIQNGAVRQSNFHDYPMLRINEAPEIETFFINSGESLGGAGEPGTPAIAPALANAIFNATGKRIRELPINMHDLRDLESRDVA